MSSQLSPREFEHIGSFYTTAVQNLLSASTSVEPRGMATTEIHPASFTIIEPNRRLMVSPTRAINPRFMVAELLWILRGSDDLDSIAYYVENLQRFSDDGATLNGAYGRRLRQWARNLPDFAGVDQLEQVYNRLQVDRDSRQGVNVIFNPERDFEQTKDVPCNVMLMWLVRDGELNLSVIVRSQDIYLGFPYDFFNWSVIHEFMASVLGIPAGKIHYSINSLHAYTRNSEELKHFIQANSDVHIAGMPKFPRLSSWDQLDALLHDLSAVERITREADPKTYDGNLDTFHDLLERVDMFLDGIPLEFTQLTGVFLLPFIYKIADVHDTRIANDLFARVSIDINIAQMYVHWMRTFQKVA